jgi:hypothetical protein
MNKVIINTNRKGFSKYNGKIGIFKEIIKRTNVNGYFYMVEVDGKLLKLYESDFKWLETKNKSDDLKKDIENIEEDLKKDLYNIIINSSKNDRQKVLKLLKQEYKKYTGIQQMVIAQAICQLELIGGK